MLAVLQYLQYSKVDLCGILPYKRMYPHKCGIKINFDILTTENPLNFIRVNAIFLHRASLYMSVSNTRASLWDYALWKSVPKTIAQYYK